MREAQDRERETVARDRGRSSPGYGDSVNNDVLAQIAYDAYGESVGWKNYQGLPMPSWEDLPPAIQQAWRAAVDAAVGAAVRAALA